MSENKLNKASENTESKESDGGQSDWLNLSNFKLNIYSKKNKGVSVISKNDELKHTNIYGHVPFSTIENHREYVENEEKSSEDEYVELDFDLLYGRAEKIKEKVLRPHCKRDQLRLLEKARRLKRKAVVELSRGKPVYVESGNEQDTEKPISFKIDLKGENISAKDKTYVPLYKNLYSNYYIGKNYDETFGFMRYYSYDQPPRIKNVLAMNQNNYTYEKCLDNAMIPFFHCSSEDDTYSLFNDFSRNYNWQNEINKLNKIIEKDSTCVAAWLRLAELHGLSAPENLKSEAQSSVIEKALSLNSTSITLMLKFNNLLSYKFDNYDAIDKKWSEILYKYATNIDVCCKYIEFKLFTFHRTNTSSFMIFLSSLLNRVYNYQSDFVQSVSQKLEKNTASKFQLILYAYYGLFLIMSGMTERFLQHFRLVILFNILNMALLRSSSEKFYLMNFRDSFLDYFTASTTILGEPGFEISEMVNKMWKEIKLEEKNSNEMKKNGMISKTEKIFDNEIIDNSQKFMNNQMKEWLESDINYEEAIMKENYDINKKWLFLEFFRMDWHYTPIPNSFDIDQCGVEDFERSIKYKSVENFLFTLSLTDYLIELIYIFLFFIGVPVKSNEIKTIYKVLDSLGIVEDCDYLVQTFNVDHDDKYVKINGVPFQFCENTVSSSSHMKFSLLNIIFKQLLEFDMFSDNDKLKLAKTWQIFNISRMSTVVNCSTIFKSDSIHYVDIHTLEKFAKSILSLPICRNDLTLWMQYIMLHSISNANNGTFKLIKKLIDLKLSMLSTESIPSSATELMALLRLFGDLICGSFTMFTSVVKIEKKVEPFVDILSVVQEYYLYHAKIIKIHNQFISSDIYSKNKEEYSLYMDDFLIIEFYRTYLENNNSLKNKFDHLLNKAYYYMKSVDSASYNNSKNNVFLDLKLIKLLKYIYVFSRYYNIIPKSSQRTFILNSIQYLSSFRFITQWFCELSAFDTKSFSSTITIQMAFDSVSNTNKLALWNVIIENELVSLGKFCIRQNNISSETLDTSIKNSSCGHRLTNLCEYAMNDENYNFQTMPHVWRKCLFVAKQLKDQKFLESVAYRALQNCAWSKFILLDIIEYGALSPLSKMIEVMEDRGLRVRVLEEELEMFNN